MGNGLALPLSAAVGAGAVAGHVLQTASGSSRTPRPPWSNGGAGLLFGTRDEPIAVLGFTVSGGRIAGLDVVADPAKLRHLAIQR
jgi:hypothetical protein